MLNWELSPVEVCCSLWLLQEEYDRIRPLHYPGNNKFFMICFSINDRSSLENVEKRWLPELDHFRPDAPRILVGCKSGKSISLTSLHLF